MSGTAGIIYPPPELRGIVDSTAKYVAKNGGAFEERIKREHKDKPKFGFLFPEDPFNAYYQSKVRESRNQLLQNLESSQNINDSSTNSVSTKQQQPVDDNIAQECDRNADNSSTRPQIHDSQNNENEYHSNQTDFDQQSRSQHKNEDFVDRSRNGLDEDAEQASDAAPRVRLKLDEYIQEMTMKFEEPPVLNFLAAPATDLTFKDCDIIKLTSQFIASYGRSFLFELVSREQNNSQFDFLKPQHGQFPYMTNLIMQYALIRNQPLDILDQLERDANSQKKVLEKIKMRSEWTKMLELEQKKREEAREKERILYSQIDWHDFVVVETIDYQPDEKGEYPPTTADQVGTRLLIQQRSEEHNAPQVMEVDMDVESDQEEEDEGRDEGHVTGDEDNSGFKVPFADNLPPRPDRVVVMKDYDPKSANKISIPTDNYFVSPITNERVPVDKIHEHVRYNLSDPRYLEKKDRMLQERINEEAVFASGSQIQNSLKSLAERRTDIFGMDDKETAIGRRIGEEDQSQTKDDRLIWDGHKSSLKKKRTS